MVDKETIKYLPIDDFRDLGFLQEINRLVLHPAGLALAMHASPGESTTIRIWDYRDDPEGMLFVSGEISQEKIDQVISITSDHGAARRAILEGHVIQQSYHKVEAE